MITIALGFAAFETGLFLMNPLGVITSYSIHYTKLYDPTLCGVKRMLVSSVFQVLYRLSVTNKTGANTPVLVTVGDTGLEPVAFSTSMRRSSQLS